MLIRCLILLLIISTDFTKPAEKIAPLLKKTKAVPGYWKLFRKKEKYFLELNKKQMGKDFLMTASIAHGIGTGGVFGGTLLPTRVVQFKKIGDEIRFIYRNIAHIASGSKPLQSAIKVAFQDQLFQSYPILALEKNRILLDVTKLLKGDLYQFSMRLGSAVEQTVGYNPKLSYVREIKNFSANLEVRSSLIYTGRYPGGASRHVELLFHYSFFPFPKNGYRPRQADQRVGNFITALKDYSRIEKNDPFLRYINRWNLEKVEPSAKRSLPKKPIVFYLARTIPHKYRNVVREAILEWNKAFEKIGFVGAIEARIQGDKDRWELEDNRYHVVSWITTDKPLYGAIGPSRVNPLTGQILDADILVDESKIRGKVFEFRKLFGREDSPSVKKRPHQGKPSNEGCHVYDVVGNQAGLFLLSLAEGPTPELTSAAKSAKDKAQELAQKKSQRLEAREEYIRQALKWVLMHEVGHTLGFRHNFKASVLHETAKLHDKALVKDKGLYGSVMEYPGLNISLDPKQQGFYFSPTLGPYDYWVVEYSYGQFKKKEEKSQLAKIASRSTEHDLSYATDEDTRGVDYSDMDPYTATFDLGSDPMTYAVTTISFIHNSWGKIVDRMVLKGESYEAVQKAYLSFVWTYIRALRTITRFIGGKEFSRLHRGDANRRPIQPVSFKKQRQALSLLNRYAFHETYLKIPTELAESMPTSRWWHWGSDIYGKSIDKNVHRIIAYVQKSPLDRLLSPHVLGRIIDQAALYQSHADVLGLDEFFDSLSTGVFSEIFSKEPQQKNSPLAISTTRRELQRHFLDQLILLANRSKKGKLAIPYDARSVARANLRRIDAGIRKTLGSQKTKLDNLSRIHLEDTTERIQAFLQSRFRLHGG
jgi:hypothetical protein